MEDSLWAGLTDSHAGMPMGMTAENLADKVILLYLAVRYSTVRYGTLLAFAPRVERGGERFAGLYGISSAEISAASNTRRKYEMTYVVLRRGVCTSYCFDRSYIATCPLSWESGWA